MNPIATSDLVTRHWSFDTHHMGVRFLAPTLPDEEERPLLRVRSRYGFGVAQEQLDGLYDAVVAAMKTRAYWTSNSNHEIGYQPWSSTRPDPGGTLVYFLGPACNGPAENGYRPTDVLDVAYSDLRGLRLRIAAHLTNSQLARVTRNGSRARRRT